ncbi:MAG TPA: DinB family protein [Candidatus Binatia bacterium]|nr:DinB family protein [Candidatus Binatia bacterium]
MPPPLQQSLRSDTVVRLPPIEIWQAFTHPVHLYYWLGDAIEIDLRVGGAYIVRATNGIRLDTTVERVLEGRRLVLRPTRRGDDARIEVDLVKLSGAETRVSVSDPDAEDAGPWREALENLRSVWERGIDLRESRLAVMGIGTKDLGPGDRPVRGVPPGVGVRLNAVLQGGAAQEAGLRSGDVVIAFDGEVVRSAEELVRCIHARKPGDSVQVLAIRDGQENARTVVLGRRSGRGEPPPAPAPMLRGMCEAVMEADAKLEKAVQGLSDADAYRPEGSDAWSVAQVLAHLSITERMLQCWLDQAVRGERPVIDSDPCTNASRIAGILSGRPAVRDLLDRLRRDEQETLAFLSHLPADVAAFRPRWARVAFTALDYHTHSEDHLGQIARIRAAIGA